MHNSHDDKSANSLSERREPTFGALNEHPNTSGSAPQVSGNGVGHYSAIDDLDPLHPNKPGPAVPPMPRFDAPSEPAQPDTASAAPAAPQPHEQLDQAETYTVRFYPTGQSEPSILLECKKMPSPQAIEGMPRTYIGEIVKALMK